MATILRQAQSQFSQKQLFKLVNNVKHYPEFIPWCKSTDVLEQSPDILVARLSLQKGALNHSFVTQNTLVPYTSMSMQLREGPFKMFNGLWQFSKDEEADTGCLLAFQLDYEFSTRLLSLTAGAIFHQFAGSLVNLFLKRAEEIYGKN